MSRLILRDITHSLFFNQGLTQYGEIAACPAANATQITFVMWVKLTSLTTLKTIFQFNVGSTDRVYLNQGAGSETLSFVSVDHTHGDLQCIPVTSKVARNRWLRVVCTLDQTIASNQNVVYVDGVNIVTAYTLNNNCTSGIPTSDLWIAANSAVQTFDGNLIFEKVIIGKAWTAAEVLSEFYAGRTPAGGTRIVDLDWTPNNSLTSITNNGTGAACALTAAPTWSLDTPLQARRAIVEVPFALARNATSFSVSVPNAVSLNVQQFTMRCWLKLDQVPPTYAHAMGKTTNNAFNDGYSMGFSAAAQKFGVWVNAYNNGSMTGVDAAKVPVATWFLSTATYDGATVRYYIDGRLVAATAYAAAIVNSAAAFTIGAAPGPAYTFYGSIADPVMDDRAWTAAEVRSDALLARQPTGLVAHWPLDDAATSGTVRDTTGTNPGTYQASNIVTNDTPCHARPLPIDLGIAGQELIIRPDRYVEMISGAVESVGDARRYQNRRLARVAGAATTVRPTMVRGANGKPFMRFDGSNDYLQCLWTLIAQPITVLLVYKHVTLPATGVNDCVFDCRATTTTGFFEDNAPLARLYANNYSGIASTVSNNTVVYAAFVFNGATSKIRSGGVDSAALNPGTGGSDGVTLGAAMAGTRPSQIDVGELRVLSTVPTAAELARWEAAMRTEFNL